MFFNEKESSSIQIEKKIPVFLFALLAILILITTLPYILDSHWRWLDDQMVFGQQLWPFDSDGNKFYRLMGREFSGSGVYMRVLYFFFGENPLGYYMIEFLLHCASIFLVFYIIWIVTTNGFFAFIGSTLAAFSSVNPSPFMDTMILEDRLMFFILLSLFFMLRYLKDPNETVFGKAQLAILGFISFLTAVAGLLGKETIIFITCGLIITTFIVYFDNRLIKREEINKINLKKLVNISCASIIGDLIIFLYSRMMGASNPKKGTYTSSILNFDPSLIDVGSRIHQILFTSGDVLLRLFISVILIVFVINYKLVKKNYMNSWEVLGLISGISGLIYTMFLVCFMRYIQWYYMYPVGFLSSLSIGSLLPIIFIYQDIEAKHVLPIIIDSLKKLILIFGIFVTLWFGVPIYFDRLKSGAAVIESDHALLSTIATLPHNSLILLPFSPSDERLGNALIYMKYLWHREDITFRSEYLPFENKQSSPIFVILIYNGTNSGRWLLGGREVRYGYVNKGDIVSELKKNNRYEIYTKSCRLLKRRGDLMTLHYPPRFFDLWLNQAYKPISFMPDWELRSLRVGSIINQGSQ